MQGWMLIISGAVMVLFFAIPGPIDHLLYWYYLTLVIGVALLLDRRKYRVDKEPIET